MSQRLSRTLTSVPLTSLHTLITEKNALAHNRQVSSHWQRGTHSAILRYIRIHEPNYENSYLNHDDNPNTTVHVKLCTIVAYSTVSSLLRTLIAFGLPGTTAGSANSAYITLSFTLGCVVCVPCCWDQPVLT